jgi:hypothetical protein
LKKEDGINKNNQVICFLKQKKLTEHEASNPSAVQLFKYMMISHSFFLLYGINRRILFVRPLPSSPQINIFIFLYFSIKKKKKEKRKKKP